MKVKKPGAASQADRRPIPSIPFDDALRRILKAPPQHKTTAPKEKKKAGA
jgi:hypothetical protein